MQRFQFELIERQNVELFVKTAHTQQAIKKTLLRHEMSVKIGKLKNSLFNTQS